MRMTQSGEKRFGGIPERAEIFRMRQSDGSRGTGLLCGSGIGHEF